MFDLLLTDDPSNWPWHAFFNLPLIPYSLILSRTPIVSNVLPLIPILLAWPSTSPVGSQERIILQQWPASKNAPSLLNPVTSGLTWPPSPMLFGCLLFPLTRALYRKYFTQFSHWVLDTKPAPPRAGRRLVWNIAEEGLFGAVHVRADFDGGRPQQQQQQQQAAPAGNAAPEPQLGEVAEGDEQDAAAAAIQITEVATGSIGRLVGGALLLPAISNRMGALLYHISKSSHLLRRFLGVRPSGLVPSPYWGPYSYKGAWDGLSPLNQLNLAVRLVVNTVWGGSRTWVESDPVWYDEILLHCFAIMLIAFFTRYI